VEWAHLLSFNAQHKAMISRFHRPNRKGGGEGTFHAPSPFANRNLHNFSSSSFSWEKQLVALAAAVATAAKETLKFLHGLLIVQLTKQQEELTHTHTHTRTHTHTHTQEREVCLEEIYNYSFWVNRKIVCFLLAPDRQLAAFSKLFTHGEAMRGGKSFRAG